MKLKDNREEQIYVEAFKDGIDWVIANLQESQLNGKKEEE